jgi:hypothetical protein
MTARRRSFVLLAALVLALLLIAPAYLALLFTVDTLIGGRQLIDWYLFESHPVLMAQEFSDIRASLAVVLPSIVVGTLLTSLLAYWRGLPGLLIGSALVWLLISGFLLVVGFDRTQAGLFATTLALTAFLATAVSRITRHAR